MWGSDYPHEDGVWPDSHEAIGRYLGDVSEEMRRKLVRDNCARLYGIGGG
jgi:predicted TIM-barrel fold metal-dependent hydrolase